MGRSIASITQTWQEEEAALNRFCRALRKSDQLLMEELIVHSRQHLAEASYASNLYPMDLYIISMQLELYRQLKEVQKTLERLTLPPAEINEPSRLLDLLEEIEPPPPPADPVPAPPEDPEPEDPLTYGPVIESP